MTARIWISVDREAPRTWCRGIGQLVVALLLLGLSQDGLPVAAQQPLFPTRDAAWSDPVQIFVKPADIALVDRAELAADGYGQLHVVVEARTELEDRIHYYLRWNGVSWTDPIDIAVLPNRLADLEWDGAESLALILDGGEWFRAHVAAERSSNAWTPQSLAPYGARQALAADALVTPDASLIVCYAVIGTQVECVRRPAEGSWLEPVQVSQTSPERLTNWPRVAQGSDGRLHVVWTELDAPSGWPPLGVYYAHSDDDGVRWSTPFELALGSYDQINVIADSDGGVHVAWLGAAGAAGVAGANGRYHRYSLDGGDRWSETSVLTEAGATEGWPQLALDADGVLHIVTTINNLPHYLRYSNGGWTAPSYIGLDADIALASGEQFNREYPEMVYSRGRLHALFRDLGGWWYTSRVVGDINAAVMPLPDPPMPGSSEADLMVHREPLANVAEAKAPTDGMDAGTATDMSDLKEIQDPSTANYGLLLGLLPAIVVVGIMLWKRGAGVGGRRRRPSGAHRP